MNRKKNEVEVIGRQWGNGRKKAWKVDRHQPEAGQVSGIRKGRKGLVEKEPGLSAYVERYSCIES